MRLKKLLLAFVLVMSVIHVSMIQVSVIHAEYIETLFTSTAVYNGGSGLSGGSMYTVPAEENSYVGFVWFPYGFMLANGFNSSFNVIPPVDGTISFNDGTMTLTGDMILSSKVSVVGQGKVDGQGNALHLSDNLSLNSTMTFVGDTIIDGNSNVFDLGDSARLWVSDNVTVTLQNMILKNVSNIENGKIVMEGSGSQLALDNVHIWLDGDYTCSDGSVYVHNDVTIAGSSHKFSYQSDDPLYITNQSKLTVDHGVTFSYDPSSSKNLVKMADESSFLVLNGCMLSTNEVGLSLLNGTLLVDHRVALEGKASDVAGAIVLGNNNSSNDVSVGLLPGADLRVEKGRLRYLNVNKDIVFGSRDSSITMLGSSVLDMPNVLACDGTVKKEDVSQVTGDHIDYNRGIFSTGGSSVIVTGSYRPDTVGTGTVRLHGVAGAPNVFRAEPGMIIDCVEVYGDQNRIEGFPIFNGPIKVMDENTTLTLAMQSILNRNIELNGGTIVLEDNLILADGVNIIGTGTVKLNDRRLAFGSQDLQMTSSLYWIGAADMYMNGKIDLSASWTFEGECYFNGDSTKLILKPGGNITIRNDSSIRMKQIVIAELGADPQHGKLYFEDPSTPSSSKLHIRRAALSLGSSYTIDQGHVKVEIGSGYVVTKGYKLYFDNPAKLTVDDVNLFYKTRIFDDEQNIRPEPPYGGSSPIELLGSADIIHYRSFNTTSEADSTFNDGVLTGNLYLGAGAGRINKKVFWPEQPDVDGDDWYIHLANLYNLIRVRPGVQASLTSVVLKGLRPKSIQLNNKDTSRLIFKDRVTIELEQDVKFTNLITWTFQGTCRIDGQGRAMSFGDTGGLCVQDLEGGPSELRLQNMTIRGWKPGSINIESNQSSIRFKNVKVILDNDVEFNKGSFFVSENLEFYTGDSGNPVKFIYNTDSTITSTIKYGSVLHFDRDVTFSYDPGYASNQMIEMEQKTSALSLNGATLYASDVGLQLTKGTLLIDHLSKLEGIGTNFSEGFVFGDGVSADNDLRLEFMPGGNLDSSGVYLDIKNIET